MNSKILASALFAISLSAAGAAYAQPIGTVPGDPYVLGQHPAVKGYVPLEVQMRRSNREERRRQYEENPDGSAFGRQHEYYRARGRGVGPDYAYYQGDRLPYEYRHRNYVVNDWRAHRLYNRFKEMEWMANDETDKESAPPRGNGDKAYNEDMAKKF